MYGVVWFSDVNVMSSATWWRWSYGMGNHMLWTINTITFYGNLNAQRYRDEILRPIVVPLIRRHRLMFQHDNAQPHVTRICTQFLEPDNVLVLPWPAYSPNMSPIEHALHRRVRHRVPVPDNIQQLRTAIEEEWDNIPRATINSLINSMRRRCFALHETYGGHTRY